MVAQIRTFGMTKMTVGSCSNFHKDVLACIETATPAALHVESQVGAYQEASGLLASVVNRDRAFVATKSMESADRERDNAAGVVINVTYDFLSSPVEAKRTAAELLYPKLSPYKGIGRHEYTKETAEIDGMLKVFDDEACASAAETMGIDLDVEALRLANEAFKKAFKEKTLEASEYEDISELDSKKLMNDANEIYEEIVRTVNAYAIVQTSDEIEQFIKEVNGLVATYSDIAGSETSTDAPEPTPGTPETPDETPDDDSDRPTVDDGDDGEENLPPVQ